MYKMFMNQISFLKELEFFSTSQFSSIQYINITSNYIPNIYFINYLGAIDCLKNLSALNCDSDVYFKFFYQLSQIYYNL